MDYSTYHFDLWEKVKIFLAGIGITAVIAALFYESFWVMLLTPACIYGIQKLCRLRLLEKKRARLRDQFQDAMQTVSSSLLSGYSVESAWLEAEKEIGELYGKRADMYQELHRMNQALRLNEPVEQLLEEFARRADLEDISNFSEVFAYAKRSGGDLIGIIATTLAHMQSKAEAEKEIELLVAAKKFEQNIMSVVPLAILVYLKLTSADYLSPLYGNLFGVLFMTGCLAVYAAAIALADRILRIQV